MLRADRRQLNRDLDRAEQNVERRLEKFSRRATAGGALLAGFGAAITVGIGLAVKAASDLQESTNAVNVVFGAASQTVHEFGQDSARSAGIATAAFNQLAAQTGSLLINFGSTQQESADQTLLLTQRAADLASVYNTSVADAMSAVNQAIRGETEAIRRYSADVTDATIQTHLNAQGINAQVSAMSVAEKAQLRLQVLMAQTANVQGDFERTSGDWANALRIAQAEVTNLMAELGQGLLPILAAVLRAVVPIVTWVKDWAAAHPGLSSAIFITVAALGAFALFAGLALISAGLVAGAIGTLGITMAGVTGVATAMWIAITGPVGLIIAGIVALIAVGVYLYHRFDAVRNIVDAAWRAIKDFAADAVKSLQPLIEALGYIVGLLGTVWDFLKIPSSPEIMAPTTSTQEEARQTASDLAQEVGKEMQKVTSALTTGRTRWRNVRFEEAQEDSATKIVSAVEQQTGDLKVAAEEHLKNANTNLKLSVTPSPEADDTDFWSTTWQTIKDNADIALSILSFANPITAFFGLTYLVHRINWREIVPEVEGLWEDHKGKIFTALAILSFANPITAFFGLAYLVYRINWREIVPEVEGLWEDHKGKIFTALAILSFANPITAFFGLAYLVYRINWREIVPEVEGLWEDHKGKIFTALAILSFANPITAFFGLAYLVYRINWREIVPEVEGWWRDIRDKVQRAISALNPIKVTIEIVKTVKEVIRSARDIGSKALDIGSSAVSDVRDFFTDIFPWHGAGGIAMAPHLAVVGDVPEAIIPLDRLASIMGGGRTMVFNVENLYGVDDLEDFVQEANLLGQRMGREDVLT